MDDPPSRDPIREFEELNPAPRDPYEQRLTGEEAARIVSVIARPRWRQFLANRRRMAVVTLVAAIITITIRWVARGY